MAILILQTLKVLRKRCLLALFERGFLKIAHWLYQNRIRMRFREESRVGSTLKGAQNLRRFHLTLEAWLGRGDANARPLPFEGNLAH